MEYLVQRLDFVIEKCRGYNNPRFIGGEGKDCPQVVKTALIEDYGDDHFPIGYKHPVHNYVAAFVRKCIKIAENGRYILHIPDSQIDSNPEVIKEPFMLSPPASPQDKGFIEARFKQHIKQYLISQLGKVLDSMGKDFIISNFNNTLIKYGYPHLKSLSEPEFMEMYFYIYKETAWAASIAEYYATDLKRIILSNPSPPRYHDVRISNELDWLPKTGEEAATFKLDIEAEENLRNFLISHNVKENDLVFFSIPGNRAIMIYFMDEELGNNFRGYVESVYMPPSFYQFLGRMGLTSRVAENLYNIGHIIRPEPGYWPPHIQKKRLD
jgi:hypothetical protein